MNVFTFDNQYYFERQPFDDCWYAYTHPRLNLEESEDVFHGYFDVSDGKFVRNTASGRGFSSEQKLHIEMLLAKHKSNMTLEQFETHKELPTHYVELGSKSNRYADILDRIRTQGIWDPDVSIAFEQLTNEEPAYRLTRDFVLRLLERTTQIPEIDRDAWLNECLMDTWTYDTSSCAKPGENFESFYKAEVGKLLIPNGINRRKDTDYRLYQVKGIPDVYLFSEETAIPSFGMKTIDSRHYLDRDSAVVPVPLPSYGGQAYYIL